MHKLTIFLFGAITLCAADISAGSAASAAPGQTLTIPVTFRAQGAQIVALQFNLLWDKANLEISAQAGAASTAAKKSANQSDNAAGTIILILGSNPLDLTPLGDGVVVDLTVKVGASTPPGKYSLTIQAANGSDATGKSIPLDATSGSVTLAGGARQPASLVIGSQTVSATEAAGVSFNVTGDLIASDTIALTVEGQIGIGKINDNAASQQVNAAGVFTAPDPGGCELSPNSLVPTACAGTLLIGNDSIGYFPLFAANAANGAGPPLGPIPVSLSLNSVPLSSIFGPDIVLADGTTLILKVNDSSWDDNSGSFQILASCAFGLGTAGAAAPATTVEATLSVTAGSGCPWTAKSADPWIRIANGASGTGAGTINFTVDRNSGARRNGEIILSSPSVSSPARFSVSQAGASSIFTANVKNLSLPDNLVIAANDKVGTSFVLLATFVPSDTFSANVYGEPTFFNLTQDGTERQKVNAAGVYLPLLPGDALRRQQQWFPAPAPVPCSSATTRSASALSLRPMRPTGLALRRRR